MANRYSSRCAFKVGIVGTGKVGMTTAFALLLEGIPTDLVLIGRDKAKVEGEKLDLDHALPFLKEVDITASDDYSALRGCDVVIFTAGAAQEPGETRLDLTKKNLKIVDEIVPLIVENAPHAVLVMVTNPVDILTLRAIEIAQAPPGQIFGSGTMLDTARFRFHLSDFLNVNPRSIHTYILGEHGDSSFPVLSSATIGGQKLMDLPEFSEEKAREAFEKARQAAYKIIESKGATFYAIGAVICNLVKAIQNDSKSVLPVSHPLDGEFGLHDVSLSLPCIVGRHGVERVMKIQLDRSELLALHKSAEALRTG